jgi:reverse gyrase
VFNAITKKAILEAMDNPRQLDTPLVDAYLARRALDYLVGFTLSPVLWRKLPGARSAGRVQSVALRLICDREMEIEVFRAQEYWSIFANMKTPAGDMFQAGLTGFDGRKIGRHDINNEAEASTIKSMLESASFAVDSVASKPARRNPAAPFTTSTLQQEASRKLGFAASRTMQVAQKLYEGISIGGETSGLITYMRTDGVQIAGEAIAAARSVISQDFGANYVPEKPRVYSTKAKNAQEAHEAIRPTDLSRRPKDVARFLDPDQAKLYELIWKRTMASQMESAVLERTTIEILAKGAGKNANLRATGSVVRFDGFLALYQEGRDDEEDENSRRLPAVDDGAALTATSIDGKSDAIEALIAFIDARPSIETLIVTRYWLHQMTGYTYRHKGDVWVDDEYEGSGTAYNATATRNALARFAMRFSKLRIILLDDVPSGSALYMRDNLRRLRFDDFSKLGLPLTDYAEQRSGYERVLLDIADKFPNVQYRPLFQNICNERLCPLFDGKTLLFRDGDHLSWKGALKLVDAARDLLVKDVQSPASPGEAAKLRLWAAPR